MSLMRIIVGWMVLWFSAWLGWIFLFKSGINSITTYRTAGVYLLFLSLLVGVLYRTPLSQLFLFLPLRLFPLYVLFAFFATIVFIYFGAQRIFDKNVLKSHQNNNLFFAMMDYRFLFVKSCDILFQQLAFLSLVLSLKSLALSITQCIIIAGCVFGAVHLPLLKLRYHKLVHIFVLASFFAGFIFAFLIFTLPYGFIYAYIIHWMFYLYLGLSYNVRVHKQIRKTQKQSELKLYKETP